MAWNHQNTEKSLAAKGKGGQWTVRLLIVALGLALVATGVWWLIPDPEGSQTTQPAKAGNRLIKEVEPEVRVEPPRPSVSHQEEAPPKPKLKDGVVVVSATTNKAGVVVETLRLANGKTIEKVHPPKSLFSNASDQMIALALSVKPGQSMAPLPNLSGIEKEFVQSLMEPIRISDDDSPEDKAIKLAVKEARAYIAAEIKNGRTVQECLNEHREQMEKIADSHQMAVMEMQKMREKGASDDDVREFRARINEYFRDKNLPELPEPKGNPHKRRINP